MRDFNEILCPNEKLGGQSPIIIRFQLLNNFLSVVNVECVHIFDQLFASKKRVHTHLLYERLDRTIARKD